MGNTKTSLDPSNNGSGQDSNYSPPRGLKDIFASKSTTGEFKSYLGEIDKENEDQVMVTRLNFVLQCKRLNNGITSIDIAPSAQVSSEALDRDDNQTHSEIQVD